MSGLAPYYSDEAVTLYLGDALDVLRGMPEGSVDCIVTSPPYYGQRDYRVEGQYGLEASPGEYVAVMRAVFAEVRRVLNERGTCWLVLGDGYSSRSGGAPTSGRSDTTARFRRPRLQDHVPPKSLVGMPWQVALALREDGWIVRNAIVWWKPNVMPLQPFITDRVNTAYELVFVLARSRFYDFDQAALPDGDVWTIPTRPFPSHHPAPFPPELPRRCLAGAGLRPGAVVLDPFSGKGTTGVEAVARGCRYIGIDLNPAYHDLAIGSLGRGSQGVLLNGGAA